MCGIVGFSGKKDALPIVLDTLSYLEYRGYDSAGVAFFNKKEQIEVVKEKGRVSNLVSELAGRGKGSTCAIGHTRWATHGEPSRVNAHPHGTDNLSIVHNGIIENCHEIKDFLAGKGYTFVSDTDTEICAKLLDYHYLRCKNPLEAIGHTCSTVSGSYAIGAIFSDYPDTIFAFRCASPLVVAPSSRGSFIVSDVSALSPYTKSFYLVEDGEVALLTAESIEFFGFSGTPIHKEAGSFKTEDMASDTESYPHFMLKEIFEEPAVLRRTAEALVPAGLSDMGVSLSEDKLKNVREVHIVACGTAYHAGLCVCHVFEKLLRVPARAHYASEFRYSNPVLSRDSIVIFVSQSGETADTLAALRLCKSMGIHTIAVVNVHGSAMAQEAHDVICTKAGREISVASTKAYVVQISSLCVLAVKTAYVRGNIDIASKEKLLDTISNDIPKKITSAFKCEELCRDIAEILKESKSVFFMGRGTDYAQSCEAALKAKEISYIHCEAYPAGELKHGSIALIEDGVPVVAIITCHKTKEKIINNIREVKSRGAFVILLISEDMEVPEDMYDRIIRIPCTEEIFMPMVLAPITQLIAYYMAVFLGNDPDRPRNLAKSVTVE